MHDSTSFPTAVSHSHQSRMEKKFSSPFRSLVEKYHLYFRHLQIKKRKEKQSKAKQSSKKKFIFSTHTTTSCLINYVLPFECGRYLVLTNAFSPERSSAMQMAKRILLKIDKTQSDELLHMACGTPFSPAAYCVNVGPQPRLFVLKNDDTVVQLILFPKLIRSTKKN
jgi:hypothetical protein